MAGSLVVVGAFTYLDDTIKAIKLIKESKLDFRVYSPTTQHMIEELVIPEKSPIRFITWLGAITGLTAGFALAIWCSLDYPLRVSAKDIVSPPGFFVIGYECMILFSALATFLGMLHFCRIPDILRQFGYDPRFSDDKFGVVVGCDRKQVDAVKARLLESGAIDVDVREAL